MAKAYLEPQEITKLEQAAEYLRDKLLIRLLFHLGCRVSEALGITVKDLDFKNKTVIIQHLKTRIDLACPACGGRLSKIHKFCPGCGNQVEQVISEAKERHRYRKLPVDKDTMALIKEYVRQGGAITRQDKQYLFSLNRHRAWEIVKDCALKAGFPKLVNAESGKEHNVSPHRLRDAFAVHAVKLNDSGDGLRLLQEHLGHHNITTTMKYRKVSGEEHKDWYSKLWEGGKQDG